MFDLPGLKKPVKFLRFCCLNIASSDVNPTGLCEIKTGFFCKTMWWLK